MSADIEPTKALRIDAAEDGLLEDEEEYTKSMWSRKRYPGALLFNLAAFILPAIYGTLSKLWIANIDSSLVSTTDGYTYYSIITETINEGLPRAAWSTVGNRGRPIEERLSLVYTLIVVQSILGFLLSVIMIGIAPEFASSFVPGPVRSETVRYLRISAFSAFASTLEVAVSLGTRSLDHPDVPLAISTVKTFLQIMLELALMSSVRVSGFTPTIQTSAIIRLTCDLVASFVGLAYFIYVARKELRKRSDEALRTQWFSLRCLKILFLPGRWTFVESAIRNAIYLYLIHGIVDLGSTWATAWGVFNTIRWGIVMVPVSALEATVNAFVGHRFALFRSRQISGQLSRIPSWLSIRHIVAPALKSALIALCVEVPLCIFLSLWGARSFAYYLSGDEEVAALTEYMWRSIDWCYIFYAVSTCLATILLATRTRWYLYQSLVSNLLYALPWAIVVGQSNVGVDNAWKFYRLIFGGSLVFSFIDILLFDVLWVWRVRRGKME